MVEPINWDDVETGRGGRRLPPGDYVAIVDEIKESEPKGHVVWEVSLMVCVGEHEGAHDADEEAVIETHPPGPGILLEAADLVDEDDGNPVEPGLAERLAIGVGVHPEAAGPARAHGEEGVAFRQTRLAGGPPRLEVADQAADRVVGGITPATAAVLPAEREVMRRHFVTTSRYEWMFWEMGYRRESWPV